MAEIIDYETVSKLCIEKYHSLGKNGKPVDHQWTTLAGVVEYDSTCKQYKVVSLGSGSKCLGQSQVSLRGDLVHDSHAEVLARRGFLLYLYEQIRNTIQKSNSVLIEEDGKFILRYNISYHFYSSHTLCGDASIFPLKNTGPIDLNNIYAPEDPTVFKEVSNIEEIGPPLKKMKIVHETEKDSICSDEMDVSNTFEDIHRTGGKCVSGEEKDPRLNGVDYHVVGVLRNKPGRGDPTLSHCCSDKFFKWSILGSQGALLMLFLSKPIYFQSLTTGKGDYNKDSMKRALYGRFSDKLLGITLLNSFKVTTPKIYFSNHSFEFSKNEIINKYANSNKITATPTSIIWSSTARHLKGHEVLVDGRKNGITKKQIGTPKSYASVCRINFLNKVKEIFKLLEDRNEFKEIDISDTLYSDVKVLSVAYNNNWKLLKDKVLINWTNKS